MEKKYRSNFEESTMKERKKILYEAKLEDLEVTNEYINGFVDGAKWGKNKQIKSKILSQHNSRMSQIEKAIHYIMDISPRQLKSKERNREFVYARMIFAYQCHKLNYSQQIISKKLNRSHRSSIVGYLKKYPDEMKYNSIFRKYAQCVEDMLK